MPPVIRKDKTMAKSDKPVACSMGAVCEYHGYPSICKDCKRNTLAKEGKYDCFNKKENGK